MRKELVTLGKLSGELFAGRSTATPSPTTVPEARSSAEFIPPRSTNSNVNTAVTNYNLNKQSPYQYTSATYPHTKTASFGNAKQILSSRASLDFSSNTTATTAQSSFVSSSNSAIGPKSAPANIMAAGGTSNGGGNVLHGPSSGGMSATNTTAANNNNYSTQRYSDPHMFRNNSVPDNGGRVMTKRKLTELVNAIGAEEGDSKTSIDNDAEDLLLDLADEFVQSVTKFACRLSKHRKVDQIDIKDVQLHLDRTWNIRVPGTASEEWKPVKRHEPSAEYTEKLASILSAARKQ